MTVLVNRINILGSFKKIVKELRTKLLKAKTAFSVLIKRKDKKV